MSIFFRYSPVPIILSQPFEKNNSRDTNGNLVTVNFPNQWGSYVTSFSTSGWISLASQSGIFLNTPGYVDVSGLRGHDIYSQSYQKIDSTGGILPMYSGSISGLIYKYDDNNLAATPKYIYNTSFNKITIPTAPTGKLLYVNHGYDRGNTNDLTKPTKEIDTFDYISLIPAMAVDNVEVTPKVALDVSLVSISGDIQIGPNYEGFNGKVLTHMGANKPASWQDADFLPEGLSFNRYKKRPILIQNDRIIFYTQTPPWATDGSADGFNQSVLEQEFGITDTIALIDEENNKTFVKLSDNITFLTFNPPNPTNINWSDIVTNVNITDPVDDESYPGISIIMCPANPFGNGYTGIGYAFSVKQGAYLSIDIESSEDAKARFTCEGNPANSPFTFRPSTVNLLSTRPNVYTSFNQIAEDIDFIVYGKKTVQYDNYDPVLFDLNANKIPAGLIPHFKIDAYISNAVSGTPGSGVYFKKYLDRAKLQPSGWGYDESAKVLVNSTGAYVVASIPSGQSTLATYANLTVSGITYSDYLITREIYLKPKPLADGTSEYIANSLLTIDQKGRIISRKPRVNPKASTKPTNIRGIIEHNSDGQAHNQVSLEWDIPESDGGSPILNYVIQFSVNNGNEWTTLPNSLTLDRALSNQNSVTIDNLSINTPYIFRVAAQNEIGISDYSDESEVFYSDLDVPGKPLDLTAVRFFDSTNFSEINLSWNAGHSGSSAVSGYVLEESLDYGMTWMYYNTTDNFITNLYETITGTDAKKDYLYRLSSWNSHGQSAYSYVYVSGNAEIIPDITDELSNWDFGKVLFTGVCI